MRKDHDAPMGTDEMTPFPELILLASSYTPFQPWEQPMSEAEALEAGTVFPSLVKPFMMAYGSSGCGAAPQPRDAKGGVACEDYRHAAYGFYGKG